MIQLPPPSPATRTWKGVLSFLDPLPRWEISQPGNVLRVFERGGRGRLRSRPSRAREKTRASPTRD